MFFRAHNINDASLHFHVTFLPDSLLYYCYLFISEKKKRNEIHSKTKKIIIIILEYVAAPPCCSCAWNCCVLLRYSRVLSVMMWRDCICIPWRPSFCFHSLILLLSFFPYLFVPANSSFDSSSCCCCFFPFISRLSSLSSNRLLDRPAFWCSFYSVLFLSLSILTVYSVK